MANEGKPVFSAKVQKAGAQEMVSSQLRFKLWDKFKFRKAEMICEPCLFFSYDIHETHNGKTKLVRSGFGAFNMFSKELDGNVAGLGHGDFEKELSGPGKDAEAAAGEAGSASAGSMAEEPYEEEPVKPQKFLKPNIPLEDARKLLPIMVASENNSSKENVLISGLNFSYVPFWHILVEFGGSLAEIEINAVTEKIMNPDAIPKREKTERELFHETIGELKRPGAWVEYPAQILSSFFMQEKKMFEGKRAGVHDSQGLEFHDGSIYSPNARVLILAIIALLVLIWVVFLR